MKTKADVSADKLRGGFYTPSALVDFVLHKVVGMQSQETLRVLEPSAGDGAFIRGLARQKLPGLEITAIELLTAEAGKAREELGRTGIDGEVLNQSALQWSADQEQAERYDIAIGNLPFVRFQFVSTADRLAAARIVAREKMSDRGVSNLWIPMLIGALGRLKVGGRFSFVLPAECFTGVSAGTVRSWLLRNHSDLRVDLFPPKSFPGVLQEVVVLSGRRAEGPRARASLTLVEHPHGHGDIAFDEAQSIVVRHSIEPATTSWTPLLLTNAQLEAVEAARALQRVAPMETVAKFEVATVTGANAYFSVDNATADRYELRPWLTPLLPRIRHAPGLCYTSDDHAELERAGSPASLLSIQRGDDVESAPKLLEYLAAGEGGGIHSRFKCRIREPWYSVPGIKPMPLMLTKRSHLHPRLVANHAGVATTDTIYRGRCVGDLTEAALVASFHNSLTLLSAELEGRSFGGGVLELVPSETARLLVPHINDMAGELSRLDALARDRARGGDPQDVVLETDRLLAKQMPELTDDLLQLLVEGRQNLQSRRLART